ncbi:hypothetical protein PQX77_005199 [Marasmius sp. AFHP31]|nr:hypothetical protein PQX77_005199 [Marasmius sp. AFHP31]
MDTQAEILKLEEAISRNRSEYQKLIVRHAELKNSLSPLYHLPLEILLLILEIAYDMHETCSLTDRSTPLWILSQTCKRWRSAAALWKRFDFNDSEGSLPKLLPKDPISIAKAWLARSNSPLKGEVCLRGVDWTRNEGVYWVGEEILTLLGNECHRWQELSLQIRNRYLYYTFATRGELFPLLQKLEVVVVLEDETDEEEMDDVIFPAILESESLQAPNLTHASMSVFAISGYTPIISTIPLPWHQLTHYSCGHNLDEGFFAIVPKLVKLQSLVFQLEDYQSPNFRDAPHGTLLNLRSVECNTESVHTAVALMSKVTLPVVEKVVLHFLYPETLQSDEGVVDSLGQAIASLQHRSSCRIQELSINIEAFTSPKSRRLSLPTVRILRLYYSQFGFTHSGLIIMQKALEALRSTTLYPRLTTLYIAVYSGEGFHNLIPALVEVVEARRAKASSTDDQLASIQIEAEYSRSFEIPTYLPAYQRLLELQREGLELSGGCFSSR